ncbi:mechanosensitive ion channel [Alteromonadaceae bacterium BrNp21-10]|nr:mechanosensitive ion channel [Alteromonadaceae bacterium BrNp21-10]
MNLDTWAQSLSHALMLFWGKIANFLPYLLAAIIIIIAGLFISKIITKGVAQIIEKLGFNGLCGKLGITQGFEKLGIKSSPSFFIGKTLHAFFILIILVVAADTLGLDRFSTILDEFVLYLPKVFGALLITLIGLFIAKTGRLQVQASLDSLGVEYAASVGRVLQTLVLFITFSLVIGQLELETELLNMIFTVMIASLGVALAIALGLGSKNIANSIVSGIYAREQLLPGDEIEIDGFKGNVVAVTTVNTIIENEKGQRLSIPNQDLLTSKFKFVNLSD